MLETKSAEETHSTESSKTSDLKEIGFVMKRLCSHHTLTWTFPSLVLTLTH